MKAIIQRSLPLNIQYSLIDKKYIPLEQGMGAYCCDNCSKLIANIATVKSDAGIYNIGFDCLETILINNSLLSTNDVAEYEKVKKMIPKVIRFSKQIKETIELNNGLDGLIFESKIFGDWITYYLVKGSSKPYNTNVKIKDIDFNFLITTLKAIFPQLQISVI